MSFLPLSHPTTPAPPSPSCLPSNPAEPSSAPVEAPSPDPQPTHHPSQPTSPPQRFTPFFTLLSSPTSSTYHHPTTHYIFSDDVPDTDPITAAALEILDPASELESNNAVTKERYILLDMDSTGSKILAAQSLSPDWAVTSTELGPAPTWDDRGGAGLMLRIEGVEVLGREEGEEEQKGLEELMEVYERRMGELRRVMDMGCGVGEVGNEDVDGEG